MLPFRIPVADIIRNEHRPALRGRRSVCDTVRHGRRNATMMGLLTDKKILLTGMLSSRSLAYGIARAALREGATLAYTYAGDKFKERVAGLAQEFGGGVG